jgi:arsenate reductase-like glutaredoxin family protein
MNQDYESLEERFKSKPLEKQKLRKISGRSVFGIQRIIKQKSENIKEGSEDGDKNNSSLAE